MSRKAVKCPRTILEENAARSRREKRNARWEIPHATWCRLLNDGQSKTIKLGSCWLVPLDAIDALLTGDRAMSRSREGDARMGGGERKRPNGEYEIGKGRPPKAFRWKKGQSGNPRRKLRRPPKDAELIERLFRRTFAVIEGGERSARPDSEIIFAQLMAKESAGDRGAAKTRDRYQRFAFAHQGPDGVLLCYAETEFTRAFSADWRRGHESKGQGDAEPGSSQAPVDLGEEDAEALKAMKP